MSETSASANLAGFMLSVLAFARAGTKSGKHIARLSYLENIRTASAKVAADGDVSIIANTRYALYDTVKYGKGKGKADPAKALLSLSLDSTVTGLGKLKAWRAQNVLGMLRFIECSLRVNKVLTEDDYENILARLVVIDAGKPKAEGTTEGTKAEGEGEGAPTVSQADFDAVRTRAEEAENKAINLAQALEKANATIGAQEAELVRLHAVIDAMHAEAVKVKPATKAKPAKPAKLAKVA